MAVAQISEALYSDIKATLDITWNDEALDRKIRSFVHSGIAYLNGKLGTQGDYESDGYPRTLLFEYVRYARDGALDVFENNYMSMILAMQNQRAVREYAENAVSTE